MKRLIYKLTKMHLVGLCIAFSCSSAKATVYTAVVSGNFNSALTWGGLLPGSILSSDVVVIPAGINVTITGVQTIAGTTSLAVNGTLNSTLPGSALVLTSGTLTGTGTIAVDSMALGLTSGFSFAGGLTARALTTTGAALTTAANVTVSNTLTLASGVLSLTAGNLTLGNNSTIRLAGGTLTSGGTGLLHLDSVYNVMYLTSSAMTGTELTGTGLNDITVNSLGTVTMTASAAINGMLTLTTGTLALNGQTLTFGPLSNLSTTGVGTITSTATSNLVVNSTLGLMGALRFATGGNIINNLVVNTGLGGVVSLGSDITANGIVTLTNGSLALNGHTLTFNTAGNLATTGIGTITGSSTSNIVVNSTAGLTGALRFATGGSMLNNLTLNTGTGSNVTLGSDLTTNGMLTLTAGTLTLNGNTLTLGTAGNLASSGTGSIMGGATSNLIVNSTAGLTGALRFATGGNTLNNLVINTGSSASTFLGNDLNINGLMTMTAGTLALNGNDLVFNAAGNLAAAGTGTITGNTASDIIVNSTTGLTGALRFATGSNTINNLTVNTGSGGIVGLGSDLNANGIVTLTNGTLALGGRTLTFNALSDLAATGTGTITGDALANIIVNSTSGLTGTLRFATGAGLLNNLTVNTGTGNNVTLGSDLTNNGIVTLTSGTLVLNGHTLTLGTAGNLASTGTGTITGSTTSNLIINSTAGLTGALRFATGANTLNNLTVNTGSSASSFLGTDLNISGMLTMTAGTLALNGYDLVINTTGNVAGAGTGTITGNAASDIIVNATSGLSGELRFATGGSVLNNLTVNTGSGGNVPLGSDLTINGLATLTNGTLSLNGHALTFNTLGNLATSGTGTITGDAAGDIIVNTTAGLTGMLRFTTGSSLLDKLTINTGTGATTMLGTDLTANGIVTLTSGTLALNGHTLTLGTAGDIAASGTGTLTGSATSNLVVNSMSGVTGALRFASGANTLNNLTVNTGSTASTVLGTDLNINGMLTLTAGTLGLNAHDLVFNTASNLAASGTGTISGNTASDIIVNSTTGLTGALRFATGANTIHNLTINTGSAGNVSLGSDMVANGLVTLTNGTLTLNGNSLTFGTSGDLAATGVGTIMGSATSDIIVNRAGSLGSALRFATGGNLLDSLTINTTSGGNVALNSDLALNGLLSLTTGTLVIGSHTLTFNAASDLAATGSGMLMGSTTSDIVVNSTAGLTGALRFATSGNALGDLTVNTGSAGSITLGSDLIVNSSLDLTSGKVKLGTYNLTIPAGGNVTGGSAISYVVTNSTGKMVMNLATSAAETFQVGSLANYAPIEITANAGASTGDVSLNVADGVLSAGTTGTLLTATEPLVNATWFVTSTASTINYNMKAMWSAGMEVNGFDRTHSYISHYTSGAWDAYLATAATTSGSMYASTRTGITSLSPFMVSDNSVTTGTNVVANVQPTINVYPNPAVNVLHITSTASIETVSIYDISGKCVQTVKMNNGDINISDLAAGAYLIRFTGDNVNTTSHFTKQ